MSHAHSNELRCAAEIPVSSAKCNTGTYDITARHTEGATAIMISKHSTQLIPRFVEKPLKATTACLMTPRQQAVQESQAKMTIYHLRGLWIGQFPRTTVHGAVTCEKTHISKDVGKD